MTPTPRKKLAVLQSNYIPWKGYFDMINSVDEFILYDDVQFTKDDWRNRNQVKTQGGPKWLTIPLLTKGKLFQPIKDVVVRDHDWCKTHWSTIAQSYARAPHLKLYKDRFAALYDKCRNIDRLSEVNYLFITELCSILGINTKIRWSMEFKLVGDKNERLVNLCRDVGADYYLSGPAAKSYMDMALFRNAGIQVEFMDYSGYIPYPQLHGEFTHNVSVLDLLFQMGPSSPQCMKSFTPPLAKAG